MTQQFYPEGQPDRRGFASPDTTPPNAAVQPTQTQPGEYSWANGTAAQVFQNEIAQRPFARPAQEQIENPGFPNPSGVSAPTGASPQQDYTAARAVAPVSRAAGSLPFGGIQAPPQQSGLQGAQVQQPLASSQQGQQPAAPQVFGQNTPQPLGQPTSFDRPAQAPVQPPVRQSPFGGQARPGAAEPTQAAAQPLAAAQPQAAVQPQAPVQPQASAEPERPHRVRGVATQDQNIGNRVGLSSALRAGDVIVDDILNDVVFYDASDLHLTNRSTPMIRKAGSLTPLEGYDVLNSESLRRSLYSILTQKQREQFEEHLELDFAYQVPGGARFRVNLYQQRDSIGAAFRLIPSEIKPLEDLGVPPVVNTFSKLPRGMVLVTGPTGSGKSTTLASIIDLANRTRADHIMTVEDPIEFLHDHKKSVVNQREVGTDTWSFAAALKHVLRQDPDIILVGEMRDLETISVALTAAETGHLVFATLHTQDAAQTIDRVIDVFPAEQQAQIRVQLAAAIQGVVCQTLCKRSNGPGRVVATEVMVATPGIRNLIREGKTHQIYSAMQAGKNQGMHTLDQHLADLVKTGAISYETGLDKCHHVEDFNRLAGRGGAGFNADVVNGGY